MRKDEHRSARKILRNNQIVSRQDAGTDKRGAGEMLKRQMTRDEWNRYCEDVRDGKHVPHRCDLGKCPYVDRPSYHKLDCLECDHWVEVEDGR